MKGLATWGLIGILGLIIIGQAWGISISSIPLEDPGGTDQPLVSKGTQLIVICRPESEDVLSRPPPPDENKGQWTNGPVHEPVLSHLPDYRTGEWTSNPVGDGCTGWWHLVPYD
jgi:hypothetical protein